MPSPVTRPDGPGCPAPSRRRRRAPTTTWISCTPLTARSAATPELPLSPACCARGCLTCLLGLSCLTCLLRLSCLIRLLRLRLLTSSFGLDLCITGCVPTPHPPRAAGGCARRQVSGTRSPVRNLSIIWGSADCHGCGTLRILFHRMPHPWQWKRAEAG